MKLQLFFTVTVLGTLAQTAMANDRFQVRRDTAVATFQGSEVIQQKIGDARLGELSAAYLGQKCKPMAGCSYRFIVSQQVYRGFDEDVVIAEVNEDENGGAVKLVQF